MKSIEKALLSLADESYRDFQARLMPTVDKNKIIGVRTPKLRAYAKKLYDSQAYETFMRELPHTYYEENNLHGFLIEKIKNFDDCTAALDKFLPYVDNWATCDMMRPKVLKTQPERLLEKIRQWLKSGSCYTVRFGMLCLMNYYLDENFDCDYLRWVASVKSEEYYVDMMKAWFFATALAKQYESTLPYIENRLLEPWVHRKTIQKAIESYRITPQQKAYLKTLR